MAVRRSGWLAGAVCLTLPLLSFWSPPVFPLSVKVFVGALLGISVLHPVAGLVLLSGLGPLAVPITLALGFPSLGGNAMLEAMVLAVLAGTAWRSAIARPLSGGRLGRTTFVVCVVAIASAITTTASFAGAWTHVTRGYFVPPRDFGVWHEVAVWVEALVLSLVIERTIRQTPKAGPLMAGALALGLAGESMFSFVRLGQIASRSADVFTALLNHFRSTRISPHFPDVNAIGSLFALGAGCWLTAALVKGLSGRSRAVLIAGAAIMTAALWMTGSRAALGATGAVSVLMWWHLRRPSFTTMAASLAVAGTLALSLLGTGVSQAPRASIDEAAGIRVELARVGIRMAADHPWLGVGLGEFSRHSARYISPELIARFPPAAYGENSHNTLIQVLGELGVIGLVAFVWYWSRVLWPAVRRRRSIRHEPDPWLPGWTAGLCAFLLSALLGHPFLTPFVVYCVFIAAGVVAGLSPDESRTPSPPS